MMLLYAIIQLLRSKIYINLSLKLFLSYSNIIICEVNYVDAVWHRHFFQKSLSKQDWFREYCIYAPLLIFNDLSSLRCFNNLSFQDLKDS